MSAEKFRFCTDRRTVLFIRLRIRDESRTDANFHDTFFLFNRSLRTVCLPASSLSPSFCLFLSYFLFSLSFSPSLLLILLYSLSHSLRPSLFLLLLYWKNTIFLLANDKAHRGDDEKRRRRRKLNGEKEERERDEKEEDEEKENSRSSPSSINIAHFVALKHERK